MKYETYSEMLHAVKQHIKLDSNMRLYNTLFVSKNFSIVSLYCNNKYYLDILMHNGNFYNMFEQMSSISFAYKLSLVDNIYSVDDEYTVVDNMLVHKPTNTIIFAIKGFSFDNCNGFTLKQYSMLNARKELVVKNVKLEK